MLLHPSTCTLWVGKVSLRTCFAGQVGQNQPEGFSLNQQNTSSIPKGLQMLLSAFAIALSLAPLPKTDV